MGVGNDHIWMRTRHSFLLCSGLGTGRRSGWRKREKENERMGNDRNSAGATGMDDKSRAGLHCVRFTNPGLLCVPLCVQYTRVLGSVFPLLLLSNRNRAGMAAEVNPKYTRTWAANPFSRCEGRGRNGGIYRHLYLSGITSVRRRTIRAGHRRDPAPVQKALHAALCTVPRMLYRSWTVLIC